MLPAARGLAGKACATEGAPFPGMEALTDVASSVAFPLLTMPFAEGDGMAGTAFSARTGACLGVGMLADGVLGCLSGTAAPACTENTSLDLCLQASLNKAMALKSKVQIC